MPLKVGSFNIRDFSRNSVSMHDATGSQKRDVSLMAQIIRDEKMDLVALQEIWHLDALEHLAWKLGRSDWDCRHGVPPGSKNKAKGFAFLWRKTVVACADSESPSIWTGVGATGLTRSPFVGTFSYKGKHVVLINVQLAADDTFSSTKQAEFAYLCSVVFPRAETNARSRHLASYALMLGDYNLRWEDMSRLPAASAAGLVTVQDEPTTIKEGASRYHWSLDHFTYSTTGLARFSPRASRVDAPTKYCNGEFDRYRETVSNHVPITLDIPFYG